jgi:predicted dithiol-disulfide oxidoreductase (DUF899 family)
MTSLARAPAAARHPIVSREEWLAARKALLAKEKELTRLGDRISAERRALPWVEVEKDYVFEGPDGSRSLGDLFAGHSQLVIYHFMFGPGWKEGCGGCSFIADHIDGANLHLKHHDVSLVVVSRAAWREFAPFKKRMGWRFDWVSSHGNDFNVDYGVSFTKEDIAAGKAVYNFAPSKDAGDEMPGVSVFYKDEAGRIFHTYSTYARGGDILIGAHNWLDLTPKGRNETTIMDWVRLHDSYEEPAAACCRG